MARCKSVRRTPASAGFTPDATSELCSESGNGTVYPWRARRRPSLLTVAEQVRAAMGFAFPAAARPQEPIEAFLKKVVGNLWVGSQSGEIAPERPRRPIVESAEGLLVHLERHVELWCLESFDLGECQVAHYGLLASFAALVRRRLRLEQSQTPREEE